MDSHRQKRISTEKIADMAGGAGQGGRRLSSSRHGDFHRYPETRLAGNERLPLKLQNI